MTTSAEPSSRPGPDQVANGRGGTIIRVIEEYVREHGCSPSNREIAERAGLASPSSVGYHLQKLRAAGLVSYDDACPRTVRVLRPSRRVTRPAGQARRTPGGARPRRDPRRAKVAWVPVAGQIAAGGPILAQQSIEDYWPLPKEVVGGQEGLFMLKVVGDSMIGAGILPGDWVVISPLFQAPHNGDIVAATIDEIEPEGTVKRYVKIGRQVWLMPHNLAHTPIPGGKAEFAGKVIAVLRRI